MDGYKELRGTFDAFETPMRLEFYDFISGKNETVNHGYRQCGQENIHVIR
jgi:hypothetical protein